MDSFLLAFLAGMAVYMLIASEQRKRIALLGVHLHQFNIERLMETLADGYLRALGENDQARRDQIWGLLESSESQLGDQFASFAKSFAKLDEAHTRVSKLALTLPLATRLLPAFCFDARKAFTIHSEGFTRVAANAKGLTARDKAFTMMAELLLMQHTCHWFCKSRAVASARLLARHQTPYEKVLASVSPETRQAYLALTGQ